MEVSVVLLQLSFVIYLREGCKNPRRPFYEHACAGQAIRVAN